MSRVLEALVLLRAPDPPRSELATRLLIEATREISDDRTGRLVRDRSQAVISHADCLRLDPDAEQAREQLARSVEGLARLLHRGPRSEA